MFSIFFLSFFSLLPFSKQCCYPLATKTFLFKWHTLSACLDRVSCSRGIAALPINFPLHPPLLSVQEKRIPDLLILLFLLSWSIDTSMYWFFQACVCNVFILNSYSFFMHVNFPWLCCKSGFHNHLCSPFLWTFFFKQWWVAHFSSKRSLFIILCVWCYGEETLLACLSIPEILVLVEQKITRKALGEHRFLHAGT